MGFYQLSRKQFLSATQKEVWEFIADPKNLKRITPGYMGFDITSGYLPDKMYPGLMVSYEVSPLLAIKMNWITEITHMQPEHYFVDEQRAGPYKLWHHEHILTPAGNGVLMEDRVTYLPPFGWLGRIAQKLIIRKKLQAIFDYREAVLNQIFAKDVHPSH